MTPSGRTHSSRITRLTFLLVVAAIVCACGSAPVTSLPGQATPSTPTAAPSVPTGDPSVSDSDARRAAAIALAWPPLQRIASGASYKIDGTAPATSDTVPDLNLIAVTVVFSKPVTIPAGLPMLRSVKEDDPHYGKPYPLSEATVTSTAGSAEVESIQVSVNLAASRVFVINYGQPLPSGQ